jgi:ketosteroid isomerase-like protein
MISGSPTMETLRYGPLQMSSPTVEAETPEQLVQRFVAANQAKDKAAMMSMLADDIDHEIPFNESGRTEEGGFRRHRGKAEMSAFLDVTVATIDTLHFVDPVFSPTADGRAVFVETYGDCRMADGKTYKNRYVFRYDVENGKITRLREYYNPITSGVAFGRPIAGRMVIDSLA